MSDAPRRRPVFADATQVAGTGEVMIEMEGVVKRFGSFTALRRHRPAASASRRSSS